MARPQGMGGVLDPWPGIELVTPALEAKSLKHWATGEDPALTFIYHLQQRYDADLQLFPTSSYWKLPTSISFFLIDQVVSGQFA